MLLIKRFKGYRKFHSVNGRIFVFLSVHCTVPFIRFGSIILPNSEVRVDIQQELQAEPGSRSSRNSRVPDGARFLEFQAEVCFRCSRWSQVSWVSDGVRFQRFQEFHAKASSRRSKKSQDPEVPGVPDAGRGQKFRAELGTRNSRTFRRNQVPGVPDGVRFQEFQTESGSMISRQSQVSWVPGGGRFQEFQAESGSRNSTGSQVPGVPCGVRFQDFQTESGSRDSRGIQFQEFCKVESGSRCFRRSHVTEVPGVPVGGSRSSWSSRRNWVPENWE